MGEKIPEKAQSLLLAFLSTKSSEDEDAPEANGYEFQSGGIVDMLKKLQDEFRAKLGTCQKEEMNSKHNYDMVVQDLVDTIAQSKTTSAENSEEKARKQEQVALNKKEAEA